MSRIVKSGLIQMSLPMTEGEGTITEIIDAMYDKHIPYIEEAGKKGNLIMSDTWFDKHVYTVVVHRKHFKVIPELNACLSSQKECIELEPWDTFGSLFYGGIHKSK